MSDFTLVTDGACSGNPGPGGWGFRLKHRDGTTDSYGSAISTTNNQMELMAVIEGLRRLAEMTSGAPANVTIITDSKYVLDGAKSWHKGWVKRGWRNAKGEPVANRELWEHLLALLKPHRVTWTWVKGHAGHPDNEFVDQIACAGRDKAIRDINATIQARAA